MSTTPTLSTPAERQVVLSALAAAWDARPDLALGRLVCTLSAAHYRGVTNYPWNLTDEQLVRACRDLTRIPADPGQKCSTDPVDGVSPLTDPDGSQPQESP